MPTISELPADAAADPAPTMPEVGAATALKDEGGRLFRAGDIAAADAQYSEAVEAVPPGAMAWPEPEALVLLCHSNRAMCLLKLGRPEEALQQCEAGLALPSAVRLQPVLAKLLARKAQAALECDPPRADLAAETLLDARKRGLWAAGSPLAVKYDSLAARLPPDTPQPSLPPLPPGCPGRMPLQLAITEMLTQLSLQNLGSDDLVKFFGGLLHDHIMDPPHVCAVDPGRAASAPGGEVEEGGNLMWALCFALQDMGGDPRTFGRLLRVFVTEFGAPINQRMEQGRTALIFAAGAHKAGTVEAVLSLGADVNLHDEMGWTALMAACRLIEGAAGTSVTEMSGELSGEHNRLQTTRSYSKS